MRSKFLLALMICCAFTARLSAQCSAHISYTLNPNSSTVTFYADSIQGGGGFLSTFHWTFGDGTAGFGSQTSHTYTMGGVNARIFIVCLTMTDSASQCTYTTCDSVYVTYGGGGGGCSTTIANGNIDSLYSFSTTNTGTVPFSYSWTDNGTVFSTSSNPLLVILPSAGHNICVTVTDSNGCTATNCTYIVDSANGNCSTHIAFTNIDSAFTFSTTNSGTGPFSYSWTDNGVVFSTSSNPTDIINNSAVVGHNVCVTVTDSTGCVSTDCTYIIDSLLRNCFSYASYSNMDSLYTFTVSHIGGTPTSYVWTYNNTIIGTTATITYVLDSMALSAGAVICVVVTDSNGCTSTDCVTISNNPAGGGCQAYFVIYPDTVNQLAHSYAGLNLSTGSYGSNILWDFGDGSTSNNPYPSHTYATPGVYIVCLTVGVGGTTCYDTYCDSSFYAYKVNPGAMEFLTFGHPAGIAETGADAAIQVYPNPVTNVLKITTSRKIDSERIFNIAGQMVQSGKANANEVNVTTLSSGIYILEVSYEGQTSRTKFVKE